MRYGIVILFSIIFGCQESVNLEKALSLSSLLNTLENADKSQHDIMRYEYEDLKMHLENIGVSNDSILSLIDNNLRKSFEFSRFISELKKEIIEENGGYSMDYDLPNGWYKTIDIKDYLSSEELDSLQISGKKSMLLTLIELSNKSIAYTSKLFQQNRVLIDQRNEPNWSMIFLAKSVQEPHQTIEGPLFYSFNYYPIDSLQINGKWYFGNEYVEIPREEWDEIAKNYLKINLPLKLYWGDTTFQFSSKKR